MPSNAVYFVVYEAIQEEVKRRRQSDTKSVGWALFAGGVCGMAYWVVGMPPDTLKTRLQTAPEGTYPRGVRSAFIDLVTTDGFMGLYRGVLPVMLRAFPANAATFFGIELMNTFFLWVFPNWY